jgi:hypothetical protein
MALYILTKDENAVTIPNGPRIIVVESGDAMYERGTPEATSNYEAVLIECMQKCGDARYKVLSLEGRPALDVKIHKTDIGFELSYDGFRIPVEISGSLSNGFVIKRLTHGDCKDHEISNVYQDNASIDCIFDPDTNELLHVKDSRATQRVHRFVQGKKTVITLQLLGVFPPSVHSRDQFEIEIEKKTLKTQYGGRLLVPWPDFARLDSKTLKHYVAQIKDFFLSSVSSDVIIIRCSAGLGRSGLAMMIGYVAYNPTVTKQKLLQWFNDSHTDPNEAIRKFNEPLIQKHIMETNSMVADGVNTMSSFVDLCA